MELELKIRAWDGKRMIYLSDLSIGLKKGKRVSPYAYFAKDTFGGQVALFKHKIMLFTGQIDKNDKDIYAGDIVKTATDKNMKISWCNKTAGFVIDRDGWAFDHYFGEACDAKDVEVIGNIYENPSLIAPANDPKNYTIDSTPLVIE